MFRNLRLYRFTGDWPTSEELVSEQLGKAAFRECGPLSQRTSGWVEVYENTGGSLARRINGVDLLRLRTQSRVLPPAAIEEALQERIAEYRQRMGEDPRPREQRRLKAEIRDELLPKALLKSEWLFGFVEPELGIIGVDAAQTNAGERFLRYLRLAFEKLEIQPLRYTQPVEDLLRGIFLGSADTRFQVGRECIMRDAVDPNSKVRWSNFDLSDASIRDHVADGMRLAQLALEYDSVLNCVLDDAGVLRKIKLTGQDQADTGAEEEPLAALDAEFVLLTGTLRNLLEQLRKTLGGFAQAETV